MNTRLKFQKDQLITILDHLPLSYEAELWFIKEVHDDGSMIIAPSGRRVIVMAGVKKEKII